MVGNFGCLNEADGCYRPELSGAQVHSDPRSGVPGTLEAPPTRTAMPRKLKTYQTSQGFYDLAVAAPSMKSALEAWGTSRNLFNNFYSMAGAIPSEGK